MTEAGIVLGTAPYMAPEQARGKPVDQRADIWAFGCVLYELLTGQLAFGGDDVTIVLARVLERSPDFAALPAGTPPAVRRTLELCLEKDPKKRIADIRDVKLALAGAFGTAVNAACPPFWRTGAAMVAMTGVAALSLVAITWLMSRPVAARLPETHLELSTPGTATPTAFAISADGRRVVYSATEDGRASLWVRSLDGGAPTRLEGTEDAVTPFWSPDGRSLGFFQDRALRAIDVTSGVIRTLTEAAEGRGGSWNAQGDVLFAPSGVGGILRVPAQGGERVTVTALAPGQRSHGFPAFLPNGRDFLFFADGSEVGGVYAGSLGETEPKRIVDADGSAAYASGHLFFPRQGRLFAQPFDLDTLSAIGEAVSVDDSASDDGRNVIAVAASATGVVVYRTEAAGTGGRRLAWFDRSGAEILAVEGSEPGGAFALSPDEERMAITRTAGGNGDIWMIDVRRGVPSRFTTTASLDTHPLFSADGSRLIYQRFFTDRGVIRIVWRPVSGGEEESLIEGERGVIATDVSRDGRLLLLKSVEGIGIRGWDIWALPLSGDRTPMPAVVTPFDERDGQFSPDAAWVLYQSDESGRFEVYLQPFGRAGERVQVSVGGGAQARWRADGRELFYVALDGRLMAVSVQPSADASVAPTLGRPEPLFVTSMGPVVPAVARQWYVPSPEGQRFLMSVVDATSASPLEVILNFDPEARR
jgi:Tol biopolymer transport system component